MYSFIKYLFGYKDTKNEEDVVTDDEFLAEELLNLEIENEGHEANTPIEHSPVVKANCFGKTGTITYVGENYVLIDGTLYFELNDYSLNIQLNDTINYMGYKDDNDTIKVVRILQNLGPAWGDPIEDIKQFETIEHIVIGQVDSRKDRFIFIKNTDLKLNLEHIQTNFIPVVGDWLELLCTVQWDDNDLANISMDQVINVLSVKPLRTKIKSATITYWSCESGICDNHIYFDNTSLHNGFQPEVGNKVIVEAIESNQGNCTWRAIKIILDDSCNYISKPLREDEIEVSLKIEKEKQISMDNQIVFKNVNYHNSETISINFINQSLNTYKIIKWKIHCKKSDSQLTIKPLIVNHPFLPNENINFMITCKPKFLGYSKELFELVFNGFQVKRWIEINVTDEKIIKQGKILTEKNEHSLKNNGDAEKSMKNILKFNDKSSLPGVKPFKVSSFVPVKLGMFPIPDKIWNALLGDSEQSIYSTEFDNILNRIQFHLPCLSSNLNISNYIDKWHTLLFMEEIQQNLQMRVYDDPKTYLDKHQDFLVAEVIGLSERRPSLITGDRAIARDIWDSSKPEYEGFIHEIRGDFVFLKFNQMFHEEYSGYDISLEFHFNRTVYRKHHQAVNLAISNLGPNILFPNQILCRPPQVSMECIKSIKWYNNKLNSCQKEAVCNILSGICRTIPYCIYGPPGTGKTITVVETILQILSLIPDSRILVATPSNSAANLITERLISYKSQFSSSILRLIAFHLIESETIPDVIRPFVATLDISQEYIGKYQKTYNNDKIDSNSRSVGRHRVTIGTCNGLGILSLVGLPRNHFTHLIVDEAGQATEPEILVPMTFIDKDKGQIILAGDPMQLGPVVMSRYCQEFGMAESYFSRILDRFPYQKDVHAFKSEGYDPRFVTKLIDNYRSLAEVLTLPSKFFYNNALVEKLNRDEEWVTKLVNDVSEIFPGYKKFGGLYMYGIRGCNYRAEDSPSWYNPQEALMVLMSTCKLYKRNVSPDDIGIISPYIAQIKYLRQLFQSSGADEPKIGTVEEFQGQERAIIFITTVRSVESHIKEDIRHSLGFIKNPKRLNVALTRGQIAVVVFCNPHLLCKDSLWAKIINHAVNNECYSGCDLPHNIKV